MSNKSKIRGTPRPPTPLTSLADIQKAYGVRRRVEFVLEGQRMALECRRLTAAEEARLDEITSAVMPPVIRGAKPEEDRVDFTAPSYVIAKNKAQRDARAMGLYWCVPALAGGKPGLTQQDEIVAHVHSALPDQVLAILWQAVKDHGITLAEVVNFT